MQLTQPIYKRILLLTSFLFPIILHGQRPLTRFESSKGKETVTYYEAIATWKELDKISPKIKMLTMGTTDAGEPLHLVLISSDGVFQPQQWKQKNKVSILINNGIHPGEPDGIDASILLAKDIINGKLKLSDKVILAIIPVYNIGGSLNQSPFYRIDQNGPSLKGSRGNSQNLDLNRDFIKCDSREARSFAEIFHIVEPDIFLDNHVSNGADYQHVMTLLTTQHNKLGGVMGDYLNTIFEPAIYESMKQKGYDLIPYVNNFGDKPENGWSAYWDSPRYSSGYAALFGTFSFVPETHMLKPYEQRVDATYKLMQSFIEYAAVNATRIKEVRKQQLQNFTTQKQFSFSFNADRTKFTELIFKGYTAEQKPSNISGLPRLHYNREKPFEITMKFYNFFSPKSMIDKPKAYIIPQGWWNVIDLLKLNKIQMQQLKKDTSMEVEVYMIEDYKSSARPYEWHHINTDVKTNKLVQNISFRKGDWLIPMNQTANHFLMQVLEPTGEDSYFTWNFFDPILGQKEGYSAYVFEEKAEEILINNPLLKEKLEQRRKTDSTFSKNGRAQLNFIYQNSPYAEPGYMRYPVYRLK